MCSLLSAVSETVRLCSSRGPTHEDANIDLVTGPVKPFLAKWRGVLPIPYPGELMFSDGKKGVWRNEEGTTMVGTTHKRGAMNIGMDFPPPYLRAER